MMWDSYADSLAGAFQVGGEAAGHVPGCRAASHQLRLELFIPEHLTLGTPERTEISMEVAGVGGQSEECRGGCSANAGMVRHPGEVWEGFITFPWWQGSGGVVLRPPGRLRDISLQSTWGCSEARRHTSTKCHYKGYDLRPGRARRGGGSSLHGTLYKINPVRKASRLHSRKWSCIRQPVSAMLSFFLLQA